MENREILFEASNGVGWIKLNRPEKLNTFSDNMIELLYDQLLKWKNDQSIAILVIEGEGEKAFSAGGDVRQLYDLKDGNIIESAIESFSREYRMDLTMHLYPKPILSYMDGYVMGGGVGVSVPGSHRIVTERTKWAMPETSIGLYPDVGSSYFMNKMPGCIGRYLALTSKSINAAEALYSGVADYYIDSSSWDDLREAIIERNWNTKRSKEELGNLISKYNKDPNMSSPIVDLESKINKHFAFNTIEEIVDSLRSSANKGDEWADKTIKTILSKSPTSLKVTLRQLIEGEKKSIKECLMMELTMSINFMKCHDFFEGVRAVLVDKDKNPNWNPPTLEEIKEETVASFFTYPWKDGNNPLEDFEI
ncbi:enoyl-CoA hydratase/isomerase family protein [Wukongibacter baidiensis]|uniref:enoyl-CoA hydratase/isomerase family protein n=1 Tax=Wukongibacter baidiensis TaxID=1723361 RepID=UPI003D7F52C1